MGKQLVGILVVHTLTHGDIIDLEIFERSGITLFIDHALDTLVCNLAANVVLVVGAKDKATGAAVLGIELHNRVSCRSAACEEVKNNIILVCSNLQAFS